jgi:hypothetical protein
LNRYLGTQYRPTNNKIIIIIIIVKYRDNFTFYLCHEDVWGSGDVAPPFLTSATYEGE